MAQIEEHLENQGNPRDGAGKSALAGLRIRRTSYQVILTDSHGTTMNSMMRAARKDVHWPIFLEFIVSHQKIKDSYMSRPLGGGDGGAVEAAEAQIHKE